MNDFELLGPVFGLAAMLKPVAGMLAEDRGRGVVLVDLAAGAIGLAIVLLALFVDGRLVA
jgi:hypothetical protein